MARSDWEELDASDEAVADGRRTAQLDLVLAEARVARDGEIGEGVWDTLYI